MIESCPNESAAATTHPASETGAEAAHREVASLYVAATPDPRWPGRSRELPEDLFLIGRDLEGEELRLLDPRLSRVHARLARASHSATHSIGDAESRNGVFVNGRRVGSQLLEPGDVIRVGESVLVYMHADPVPALQAHVARIAHSPANVLIRGETGTGKELLANALHAQSERPGPIVPVNCAAIPADLTSAELFGHARSAFSGATRPRPGLFAAADQGTLFLDEIGDCPPHVQSALLRALQQKAIRPVGAERERPVDVRVVAATNVDLERAIECGAFRRDLYARLAQVAVRVPPLRERKHQIMPLLTEFATELDAAIEWKADAVEALLCWHWPLNVRELQALVHACAASDLQRIGLPELATLAEDITQNLGAARAAAAEERRQSSVTANTERMRLRALLREHTGNVSAVAAAMGKPRAQIYRWMKAMGLSAARFRVHD